MAIFKVKNALLSDFDDICFRDEYASLFACGDISLETFCYRERENEFYLSYLKEPISSAGYFDFQTPYGYTGPICNTDEGGFLSRAWQDFYRDCANKGIICGLIRFNPILENHAYVSGEFVQLIKDREVVVMETAAKSLADVWPQYSKDNKNKINRAIKSSVNVVRDSSLDSLITFMKMYYETMDRLGAEDFYYFDRGFFERIDRQLKDNYAVFTAYLADKPAGGALALFTDTLLYYFLSATTEEARRSGVANLLRHESIKFALDKGISAINFGGGRSADANDSLFKFKQGFCRSTKSFYIGKAIINRDIYERLCLQWERSASADKISKHGNKVLRYRY